MTYLVRAKDITLIYPPPNLGIRTLLKKRRMMPLALDQVNLDLKAGERLALVGLNGSGKSSMLRIIAGIYQPNSGEIEVNGIIAALFNLGIGMSLELTGRTNLILQGMARGRTREEMIELTPEILEFSGLESVIDDPMYTYSQGMAMRLSFSVATAIQPDILLLDEWIGAGDSAFREKANKRVVNMVSESKGFVLASHNSTIVKRYCDKAIWLHNGVVKGYGPVDDILDEYTAFTAKTKNTTIV